MEENQEPIQDSKRFNFILDRFCRDYLGSFDPDGGVESLLSEFEGLLKININKIDSKFIRTLCTQTHVSAQIYSCYESNPDNVYMINVDCKKIQDIAGKELIRRTINSINAIHSKTADASISSFMNYVKHLRKHYQSDISDIINTCLLNDITIDYVLDHIEAVFESYKNVKYTSQPYLHLYVLELLAKEGNNSPRTKDIFVLILNTSSFPLIQCEVKRIYSQNTITGNGTILKHKIWNIKMGYGNYILSRVQYELFPNELNIVKFLLISIISVLVMVVYVLCWVFFA